VDGLILLNGKVIDDKNMPGKNLGQRRLQTPHRKYPIRIKVKNVAEMLVSKRTTFIDYNGNTFCYRKTVYGKVQYKRIRSVEMKDSCSVLRVVGVHTSFTLERPPQAGEEWAGILYLSDNPWILYDLSPDYKPPFRKMF
jgi:hypothetical protein